MKKKVVRVSLVLTGKSRFIFEQLSKVENKKGDYGWKNKLFNRLLIEKFDTADLTKAYAKHKVADLNHENLKVHDEIRLWATIAGAYDE